jgi:tetraacyldisaccharide 4'-kinase
LLTEYGQPFYQDYLLPMGRLRESRRGAKRAHALVYTKCPADLADGHLEELTRKASQYLTRGTPVFFSTTDYQKEEFVTGPKREKVEALIVITGIANNKPFLNYLQSKWTILKVLRFPDHHEYTNSDLDRIMKNIPLEDEKVAFMTTEKDMVKLIQYAQRFRDVPLYYQPITFRILKNGAEFDRLISGVFKTLV